MSLGVCILYCFVRALTRCRNADVSKERALPGVLDGVVSLLQIDWTGKERSLTSTILKHRENDLSSDE